jgi:hypothetical protein
MKEDAGDGVTGTQVELRTIHSARIGIPGPAGRPREKDRGLGTGLVCSEQVLRIRGARRITMQKLLTYVLAMGCVGTSAMLVRRDVAPRQKETVDRQLANDGAFRDGLYLGKLARAANRQMRPPIGRWSTEKDRASFAAGYRQGFGEESPRQEAVSRHNSGTR